LLLLSSVEIHQKAQRSACARFHTLLKQSPHVITWVKRLSVIDPSEPRLFIPGDVHFSTILRILTTQGHLESFSFAHHYGVCDPRDFFTPSLLALFRSPRLRRVKLVAVFNMFIPLNQLISIFASTLKELSLSLGFRESMGSSVSFAGATHSFGKLDAATKPLQLEVFELHRGSELFLAKPSSLHEVFDLKRLRSISLPLDILYSDEAAHAFLDPTVDSLQRLHIHGTCEHNCVYV
jgi:hypothetical protein